MIRTCAALVFALAAAAAQEPALHDAWLRELLDTDVKGAVADYRRVAGSTQRPESERWAATARLAELQQSGAPVEGLAELLAAAPQALQQVVAPSASTVDLAPWLAAARESTESLFELVRTTERGQPRPQARPLMDAALRWIEQQSGPGRREQRRQLLEQLQRARLEGDGRLYMEARRQLRALAPTEREERLSQLAFAQQVLRRELGDSPESADQIRQLRFPDWKAPLAPGEPGEVLARVQANLAVRLAATKDLASDRELLLQLQARLKALEGTDPAAAVAFVRRLPVLAEELLR